VMMVAAIAAMVMVMMVAAIAAMVMVMMIIQVAAKMVNEDSEKMKSGLNEYTYFLAIKQKEKKE
jgi:uncharacterized protein YcgL (UPF0745 family)